MQVRESRRQKHIRNARQFLDAADRLFDAGDYIQTSEKLWGATSHSLKALCVRRGWRHGKYAHIREAAQRVSEETGEELFVTGFRIAYSHHQNFYTDAMEPDDMNIDRPIIRRLVEKLLAAA